MNSSSHRWRIQSSKNKSTKPTGIRAVRDLQYCVNAINVIGYITSYKFSSFQLAFSRSSAGLVNWDTFAFQRQVNRFEKGCAYIRREFIVQEREASGILIGLGSLRTIVYRSVDRSTWFIGRSNQLL